MKIRLLDCENKIIVVDVGDIKEIGSMYIEVLSGDEVLYVIYKDYTIKEFDSSNTRCKDHLDARYPIYNKITGLNLLKDKDFLNDCLFYSLLTQKNKTSVKSDFYSYGFSILEKKSKHQKILKLFLKKMLKRILFIHMYVVLVMKLSPLYLKGINIFKNLK